MYPELESCEHIMDELYDFAIENRITPVLVDDAISRAYWGHKDNYKQMEKNSGMLAYQIRSHQLSVHILEYHVRSELEDIVKKRGCCGGCAGNDPAVEKGGCDED